MYGEGSQTNIAEFLHIDVNKPVTVVRLGEATLYVKQGTLDESMIKKPEKPYDKSMEKRQLKIKPKKHKIH